MYVNGHYVRALIDTGSIRCLVSSRVYDRIIIDSIRHFLKKVEEPKRYEALVSAVSSRLETINDMEAEIRIWGLVVPATVCVVKNLAFDLILGIDFFKSE